MKRNRIFSWGLGCLSILAAIVLILLALMYWYADPRGWRRQSEQELITRFRDHRAAFETLATMASTSNIPFRRNTWFAIDEREVGSTGRVQYLTRRAELGNPSIWAGNGKVEFDFSSGTTSAIGPEWFEGISFMPGGPKGYTVVKNLDDVTMERYGSFAVPIEGSWYLVFRNLDG